MEITPDDERALEEILARHGITYDTINGSVPRAWLGIVDALVGQLVQLGWNRELHPAAHTAAGGHKRPG